MSDLLVYTREGGVGQHLAAADRAQIGGLVRGSAEIDLTSGGGLSLDAVVTSNFTVTADTGAIAQLTLFCTNAGVGTADMLIACQDTLSIASSGGVVNIDAETDLSLNSDTGAINIGSDADTGAINIGTSASARTITIGSTSSTEVELNADLIDLNSDGGVTISSASTSNFILTANTGGDVQFAIRSINSGAGDATMLITADETLQIQSTAGSLDIDAETGIDIDSDGSITIDTSGTGDAITLTTQDADLTLQASVSGGTTADLYLNAGGSVSTTYRANTTSTATWTLVRGGGTLLECNDDGQVAFTPTSGQDFTVTTAGAGDIYFRANVDGDEDLLLGNISSGVYGVYGNVDYSHATNAAVFGGEVDNAGGGNAGITLLATNTGGGATSFELTAQSTGGNATMALKCDDDMNITYNDDASTGKLQILRDTTVVFTAEAAGGLTLEPASAEDAVVTCTGGGVFDINSATELKTVTITGATATYTALNTDLVILCDQTVALTITLPSALATDGRILIIKDIHPLSGGPDITVDTEGSEEIDGQADWDSGGSTAYVVLRLISDGTNWFIW
jgi:hypothetical protein